MPFASSRSPLADGWGWLLGFGLLCFVGGVLAFVHPFAASLTVVSLAALCFIMAGIMKAVYAARIRDTGAFIFSLLIVLGIATRWLSALAMVTIFIAWALVHHFGFLGKSPGADHGELIVLYLWAFLTLIVTGSGRYSIEAMFKDKPEA